LRGCSTRSSRSVAPFRWASTCARTIASRVDNGSWPWAGKYDQGKASSSPAAMRPTFMGRKSSLRCRHAGACSEPAHRDGPDLPMAAKQVEGVAAVPYVTGPAATLVVLLENAGSTTRWAAICEGGFAIGAHEFLVAREGRRSGFLSRLLCRDGLQTPPANACSHASSSAGRSDPVPDGRWQFQFRSAKADRERGGTASQL
jgi:hypothetical protein